MLNSISWQEFLTVVGIAIGIYYLVSTLLLYHADILQWIKGKSDGNPDAIENGNRKVSSLMGETRKQEASELGRGTVVSEEILVSSQHAQDTSVVGTVSDFLEESKALAALVSKDKGDRGYCVLVFRSLLARYPQLIGSSYQEGIAVSLHHTCKDVCGFLFTEAEINSWWPTQS